ncbi:MAG: hypothetical protein ACTSRP_05930 [Candidatus Helarchaeota archaeon]
MAIEFLIQEFEKTLKRSIIIEKIEDLNNLDNLIYIDVKTPIRLSKLFNLANRYKIVAFLIKCDENFFGHVICYYNSLDKIMFFEYFSIYGQIPGLIQPLIDNLIKYAKRSNCRIILGPYNLLGDSQTYGFDSIYDNLYIKMFKNSGFKVFRKKDNKILLSKYL